MNAKTMDWITGLVPKHVDEDSKTKWIVHIRDILLNAFYFNYSIVIDDLKKLFTKGELKFLLDVMNGSNMLIHENPYSDEHSMFGHMLIPNADDSFRLYPGEYESKWGVEKDIIMNKLTSLNRFQLCCMEIWIAIFWNDSENVSVDEYIM